MPYLSVAVVIVISLLAYCQVSYVSSLAMAKSLRADEDLTARPPRWSSRGSLDWLEALSLSTGA